MSENKTKEIAVLKKLADSTLIKFGDEIGYTDTHDELEAHNKALDKIKYLISQAHTAGRQERTAEVVELVEGMEKDADFERKTRKPNFAHMKGYNAALTDIKNHLTE